MGSLEGSSLVRCHHPNNLPQSSDSIDVQGVSMLYVLLHAG